MPNQLPTLQEVQNLSDPAPSWMWTMDIIYGGNYIVNALQVLEVTFPFTYIDVDGRYRGGTTIYFPGKNNIDKVTVSLYETEDFAMLQAIKLWQGIIVNDDNIHGLPIDYMGNIVLNLYDNVGRPRASCNLAGCWPAQLSDWQLNYQQSGHLQMSVSFSVNNSEFTFYDTAGTPFVPPSLANATIFNSTLAAVNPGVSGLLADRLSGY
jgi:hypothetical protein